MFDGLWLDIRPRIRRCWRTQQLAAEEERGTPVGVRQESEMADLDGSQVAGCEAGTGG